MQFRQNSAGDHRPPSALRSVVDDDSSNRRRYPTENPPQFLKAELCRKARYVRRRSVSSHQRAACLMQAPQIQVPLGTHARRFETT